jgi:hypothetical protein
MRQVIDSLVSPFYLYPDETPQQQKVLSVSHLCHK